MLKEEVNPLFLHESHNKIERGFAILHAIFALGISARKFQLVIGKATIGKYFF